MKTIETLLAEKQHDFDSLCSVMAILRGDGGCPWDREQTHQSVRSCLIEETYEVAEAIDREDSVLLREELGDLLFQAVFHAQIEAEAGRFHMDDVVQDITAKMIHRHPHVFGTVTADTSSQVLENWDQIKEEEKHIEGLAEELRRVPPQLPALMRAQKIQKKAAKKGICNSSDVKSALALTRDALDRAGCVFTAIPGEAPKMSEALADAVFALCRAAELSGVDLETALTKKSEQFIAKVEQTEKDRNL